MQFEAKLPFNKENFQLIRNSESQPESRQTQMWAWDEEKKKNLRKAHVNFNSSVLYTTSSYQNAVAKRVVERTVGDLCLRSDVASFCTSSEK